MAPGPRQVQRSELPSIYVCRASGWTWYFYSEFYPFTKWNLTFLLKDEYDPKFVNIVYKSPLVSFEDSNLGQGMPAPSVRIQYDTEQSFVALANQLGVMSDFKAGVPRMAYRGVVSFMYKGFRIYLAPPKNCKGYDFHWWYIIIFALIVERSDSEFVLIKKKKQKKRKKQKKLLYLF